MRRSAPQPAMRKTPTGGTAGTGSCQLLGTNTPRAVWEQRRGGDGDRLTEDGDYDDESG